MQLPRYILEILNSLICASLNILFPVAIKNLLHFNVKTDYFPPAASCGLERSVDFFCYHEIIHNKGLVIQNGL